jgi:hypothetical protein
MNTIDEIEKLIKIIQTNTSQNKAIKP